MAHLEPCQSIQPSPCAWRSATVRSVAPARRSAPRVVAAILAFGGVLVVANGCRSRRARANGKGWVTLEPSPATDAGAHCAPCLSHYREISASILGIETGVWHTAPDPTGSRPSAGPFGKCGSSCNLGITPVASLGQLLTSHVIPSHQPSRVGRSSGRHPSFSSHPQPARPVGHHA